MEESKTSPSKQGAEPRQSLRERQRSLTRQALLDGAREAFAQKGYADITIDEIAERAGTSRGTFYLYFSKGSVLAELITEAFFTARGPGTPATLFGELSDAAPYTVESLAAWVEAYIDTWRDHATLFRAWMEGDAVDSEVQAMTDRRINRAVRAISRILVEVREAAGIAYDADALMARARLMDNQLQYFCFLVVVHGIDVELKLHARAIAELWYCAIFAIADDARGSGTTMRLI